MAKTSQKKTTHDKLQLEVQPRDAFGKALRKYKYQGLLAGNVYGADFKSQAVTLNYKDFQSIYKIAHETGVVYLKIGADEIPVLIRKLQYHPVENRLLHVDFRKINLRQKIETAVPVELIGESPAVNQLGGVLLTQTDHLTIESLPQDIPSTIQVDISKLTEIGSELKVSDLPQSDTYEFKEDPEKVIVSVTEHKEESITPETEAAAAPEITGEKPEATDAEAGAETSPNPEEKKEE